MALWDFISEFLELSKSINKTVQVVVAGKGRTPQKINEAIEILKKEIPNPQMLWWGENYISELFAKLSQINASPTFIGRCHTNMLSKLVKHRIFVQTVQSRSQLEELSKIGLKVGEVSCLVQFNLDRDAQKAGFLEEELMEIIKFNLPGVNIKGIFYIGREGASKTEKKNAFRYLRDRFPSLFLSMGMSGDWKIAVEEGSDMIRLGRILFED